MPQWLCFVIPRPLEIAAISESSAFIRTIWLRLVNRHRGVSNAPHARGEEAPCGGVVKAQPESENPLIFHHLMGLFLQFRLHRKASETTTAPIRGAVTAV
jgi:hypothetical protein